MFGYDKGELLNKKIETLVPRRYSNTHASHRQEFDKNPQPRSMGTGVELFGQRKNGTEFPVEVSLSPFQSEHGRFVIAFIIDITIRRQQEVTLKQTLVEVERFAAELKASNAELENFA